MPVILALRAYSTCLELTCNMYGSQVLWTRTGRIKYNVIPWLEHDRHCPATRVTKLAILWYYMSLA
mgnify:CR=1 FL=1